ncbi:MAG: hypothetical protein R6V19_16135 [Armatimonadota bacterium]
MKQQNVPLHQPNTLAYTTLAVFAAAPAGLYLYFVHRWGADMVHAEFLNRGVWPLVLLAAAVAALWLITAEQLLRYYHCDARGLTIQRAFLPPLRFLWTDVRAVRRKSGTIVVETTGGTRLKILLDYVTDSDRLAETLTGYAHAEP